MPQVAQDVRTGEVLMLGYASVEAAQQTVATGQLWFWSRQRGQLWRKGETSGNSHRLVSLHMDCDADALLALVVPVHSQGPAQLAVAPAQVSLDWFLLALYPLVYFWPIGAVWALVLGSAPAWTVTIIGVVLVLVGMSAS